MRLNVAQKPESWVAKNCPTPKGNPTDCIGCHYCEADESCTCRIWHYRNRVYEWVYE